MEEHIGITVTDSAPVVGDADTAQPERAALAKWMKVYSEAYSI
jgi:hypothetical protein